MVLRAIGSVLSVRHHPVKTLEDAIDAANARSAATGEKFWVIRKLKPHFLDSTFQVANAPAMLYLCDQQQKDGVEIFYETNDG